MPSAYPNPSLPRDLWALYRSAHAAGLVPSLSDALAATLRAQLAALGPEWTPPPAPAPSRTARATRARVAARKDRAT